MGVRPRIRPKLTRAPETSVAPRWAVQSLLEEAANLSQSLRSAADRLHHSDAIGVGKRLVIRTLYHLGAQTVPQLARAQSVSRQHIQSVMNNLMEQKLVEPSPNPNHKRSHLTSLTDTGKALVETLHERRSRFLRSLDIQIPEPEVTAATGVLRAVRQKLDDSTVG